MLDASNSYGTHLSTRSTAAGSTATPSSSWTLASAAARRRAGGRRRDLALADPDRAADLVPIAGLAYVGLISPLLLAVLLGGRHRRRRRPHPALGFLAPGRGRPGRRGRLRPRCSALASRSAEKDTGARSPTWAAARCSTWCVTPTPAPVVLVGADPGEDGWRADRAARRRPSPVRSLGPADTRRTARLVPAQALRRRPAAAGSPGKQEMAHRARPAAEPRREQIARAGCSSPAFRCRPRDASPICARISAAREFHPRCRSLTLSPECPANLTRCAAARRRPRTLICGLGGFLRQNLGETEQALRFGGR